MQSTLKISALLLIISAPLLIAKADSKKPRPWPTNREGETIAERFETPPGFKRVEVADGSLGQWLRALPLKKGAPPVMLFDGTEKLNQDAHVAVVDIDVGKRDLQQCADAVMRLLAEYLWSRGLQDKICFRSAAGPKAKWSAWKQGLRPPQGKAGPWEKTSKPAGGYRSFRAYLNKVFGVANTASLKMQLQKVDDPLDVKPGDVYIQGADKNGYGHAVMLMDVAENGEKKRIFLLSQSYMPAQDIHILKNPANPESPWYEPIADGSLDTPQWSFPPGSLRRFAIGGC